MKKINKFLLVAGCLVNTVSNANAIENDYKPYMGSNYAYNEIRAKGTHSYHNSASLNLGSVYNKYFGTEVFYQYADKYKFGQSSLLKNSSFQAYGLDMMAYLPLGCEGIIAPTVTLGLGEYIFKHSYRGYKNQRDHGWGYRFGLGVTYNISQNWSVRGLYRYVKLDKIDRVDHINEYSLGIRYTFN